jgi:hypothetical protein
MKNVGSFWGISTLSGGLKTRTGQGGYNLMVKFNEAISKLGIIELPLSGQSYTWSNNQQQPLLERLDWFFVS